MAQRLHESVATDVEAYLEAHERKSLLRFITCGSVDDGKSTLIGRMLYESHLVLEDHLAALEADSKRVGTQGGDLDFALLVDGLAAEREQGITIDVAYRYFATDRRKFIVADTPGHEQYTRNMVTGASTADLAVILVDARKGVLTQTRRHSYVVSLLGIEQVVLAVNKLDLVGYAQDVFDALAAEYRSFAAGLGIGEVTCIPLSALRGDSIVEPSVNTPWYEGPALLDHLDAVPVRRDPRTGPFRLPVQWVNRPDHDFRGFAGTVVSGTLRAGDPVKVLPSGTTSTVRAIVTFDGCVEEAVADQAVTVVLEDEVDVSRGDVLVAADSPDHVADQFDAQIVWMHDHELVPGRPYLMKLGATTVGMTVASVKHKVNVNTSEHLAAKTLHLNEIGECQIATDRPVAFTTYDTSRDLGGFVVIDRITNATVGAGMLRFALRRADNIPWQHIEVTPETRSALMGHPAAVVWLTGLSGAGKSTIANTTETRLHALGIHTFLLDGDNLRHGLTRNLGFTEADRVENIRRAAEAARLMADAGLVVLVSLISPFRIERDLARELIGPERFCEVFVDTPLEVAEQRDPKGLYAKARRGELANFTGIDSPYEAPEAPDLRIDAATLTPQQAAEALVAQLRAMGLVPR